MSAVPIQTKVQPETIATLLADELVAALVNVRIYSTTHPRVQASIQAVQGHLRTLGAEVREDPVRIGCVEELLIYRRRPLLGASIAAARLIRLLDQWGSGGIELAVGSTHTDLMEFFAAVVARPKAGEDYAVLNARLEQQQRREQRLLPPYVDPDQVGLSRLDSGSHVRVATRLYQRALDLLQDTTVAACHGGRIDFAPVQAQAEEVLNRLEADDGPVLSFARQDQYDAFTFGHSVRVAVLSLNFARHLTQDRDLLIRIGTAALLHDVGKSLIPFEILHSINPLTPEERVHMNRHVPLGAELLLDHCDSDPLAIAAAFGHHIGADGRGYPKTVHAHQATMVTQIVQICDVYEALTAARPYKQPMTPLRAYRVMLSMGDRFDKKLLRRFIETNGVYPAGQMVELDTGELAIVREVGPDMMKPVVEVIAKADGSDLQPEERGALLDLHSIECCMARRCIAAEVDPARAAEARTSAW